MRALGLLGATTSRFRVERGGVEGSGFRGRAGVQGDVFLLQKHVGGTQVQGIMRSIGFRDSGLRVCAVSPPHQHRQLAG